MKIIDGLIPFGFETNKFHYYLLCKNYCTYAIKLRENCPTENNVFIGNRWVASWCPLGFNGNVVYG